MTMITPSYLGETIEYSSLHACRSTLEDPTNLLHKTWSASALRSGQFLDRDRGSEEKIATAKTIGGFSQVQPWHGASLAPGNKANSLKRLIAFSRTAIAGPRWQDIERFQHRLATALRREGRSKSFRREAIPTEQKNRPPFSLNKLQDGIPLALVKNRRSGAQRGASENNFGQRFSVSTPCFVS